jgi:hypothetical protein
VNARQHAAWVLGALAGGSFVAITQLAVKSDPQPGDIRAVFWFAAALPLLAGSALILREGTMPNKRLTLHIVQTTAVAGPVLMVIAMSEMLQVVSFWAAIAFGALGTLMLILSIILRKPER